MLTRRQQVADSLAAATTRLDVVLNPWGFTFLSEEVSSSHQGPFASGHYSRGTTRISLSCRDTIDNLFYGHEFVTANRYRRETEQFSIGHDTLMRALGHADDCHLICNRDASDSPDAIVARDGGDRVAALIHDLSVHAAAVLRAPCEEFYAIVRRGGRGYSVSYGDSPH